MKGIGIMICNMGRERLFSILGMNIKGTGSRIRPKAMGFILIEKILGLKVNGKIIFRTVQEKKFGVTDLYFMANFRTVRKMDEVILNGQINVNMMANGRTISWKVPEYINGPMAEFSQAIGTPEKCTAKGSTNGPTEKYIMANSSMI